MIIKPRLISLRPQARQASIMPPRGSGISRLDLVNLFQLSRDLYQAEPENDETRFEMLTHIHSAFQRLSDFTEAHTWHRAKRARFATQLARLYRQFDSFQLQSEKTTAQFEILDRELHESIEVLKDLDRTEESDWNVLSDDLDYVIEQAGDGDRHQLPLINGNGAIGLALGARMALKVDTAMWYSALSGHVAEESARVYLYGRTPERVEELNSTHRVNQAMDKAGAEKKYIHSGVVAIGPPLWPNHRTQSPVQFLAVDSTSLVREFIPHGDYEFIRQLPKDGILVSAIKSQIPDEAYEKIRNDYIVAYQAKNDKKMPTLPAGGASLEEVYDMVRYITGRDDIRTVHVGGEYFDTDLFLDPEARPVAVAPVLASKDGAALDEVERWLRLPDEFSVEKTTDVTTVLMGNVWKNLSAYVMGEDDVRHLVEAYAGARNIWDDEDPGENGYVTDWRQLKGVRKQLWHKFQIVIDEMADPSQERPVAIPQGVLRDFCGCTVIERDLVKDAFTSIMTAYDQASASDEAGDWEQFREAVNSFNEKAKAMARSRNRVGGLLHAMARFIRNDLGRPEDAQILYRDKLVEGLPALRGVHMRLQEDSIAKDFLRTEHDLVFTNNGIPKYPELDPRSPLRVRDAVTKGLRYRLPMSTLSISPRQFSQIFSVPELTQSSYEFLIREINDLAEMLSHVEAGLDVTRQEVESDFHLLQTAALLIQHDGVEIREGRHVAQYPLKPYRSILFYDTLAKHGVGHPIHYYHIQMARASADQIGELAILFSRHQSTNRDKELVVYVDLDSDLDDASAILKTIRSLINRFYDEGAAPMTVRVRYGGVQDLFTLRSPEEVTAVNEQASAERRVASLSKLASLLHGSITEIETQMAGQTELVNRLVSHENWPVLVRRTGIGKKMGALRDALRVPPDMQKMFIGIQNERDQEFPDEVAVAYVDRQGAVRLLDQRFLSKWHSRQTADDAEPASTSVIYEGLAPDEFIEAYKKINRLQQVHLRLLPIKHFPIEELLMSDHPRLTMKDLFMFLIRLKPDKARDFFDAIEPFYYEVRGRRSQDFLIRTIRGMAEKTHRAKSSGSS